MVGYWKKKSEEKINIKMKEENVKANSCQKIWYAFNIQGNVELYAHAEGVRMLDEKSGKLVNVQIF